MFAQSPRAFSSVVFSTVDEADSGFVQPYKQDDAQDARLQRVASYQQGAHASEKPKSRDVASFT